ncbi:MAG: DUF4911 domain-containing protein [Caldimicrobium sp.]|nr:DUF4911 domain-containing protein [Caldimicrobium sp.]MCX7612847.1 DUF4911 domain-containing protein [Caldimicrobium sp.]MDW8183625.1 DUF4911 domain-containing protein [Caldimicrobium sp.]
MRSSWILFEIDPSQIAKLKFILEGYDHLAVLTIKDPKIALAKIWFFSTEKPLIMKILQEFKVNLLEES